MSDDTKTDMSALEELTQKLLCDDAILNMDAFGRDSQKDANELANYLFPNELALCRALLASSAWLAMALYSNRGDKRLFPRDWLMENSKVNPDVMISCFFCQLTNYGHSVVELVTKGLDTPARALIRSTADLSYTLAVIVADREIFKEYALDDKSAPRELWYRLFSNKKISKHLAKIHCELGLPNEFTEYFRQFRDENGEFFSEAVHHSPTAIFIGAQPTIPNTDKVELALLGGSPSASKATLNYLAMSLYYGLTIFVNICTQNKNLLGEFSQQEFWDTGIELYNLVQPIFFISLSDRRLTK